MKHFNIDSKQDHLLLKHIQYLITEGFIDLVCLKTHNDPCYQSQTLLCEFTKPLEEMAFFNEAVPDFIYIIGLCDTTNQFCLHFHTCVSESTICVHSLADEIYEYNEGFGSKETKSSKEMKAALVSFIEYHEEHMQELESLHT